MTRSVLFQILSVAISSKSAYSKYNKTASCNGVMVFLLAWLDNLYEIA